VYLFPLFFRENPGLALLFPLPGHWQTFRLFLLNKRREEKNMSRKFIFLHFLFFLISAGAGKAQNMPPSEASNRPDTRPRSFISDSFLPPASRVQAFQSQLPILSIDTRGKNIRDDIKQEAGFGIIYKGPGQVNSSADPWNHFKGDIYIELRGSSSNYYSPKKSYGFKIVDQLNMDMDTSILGLPSEHSFVLHAAYFDKTLMRNMLAYKIYGHFGHYSPRTRYVELVINGQYQGVYLLVEKIKRDDSRVDIAKLTKTDISGVDVTGGYIVKIDRKTGNGADGWFSSYKKDPSDSLPAYFQFDYPEYDSLMQQQKDYIKNYIDSFETVMVGPDYKDELKGYRRYIDPVSFVDKLIINELSKNIDGYRLSEYLYKEKLTKRKKGLLFNGPAWDYDIAFGNANFGNATDPYRWQYLEREGAFYSPVWWRKFMKDEYFKDLLYCRYTSFRKTVLDTAFLFQHIDSVAKALKDPVARNYTQWPILGQPTKYSPQPVPADYAGEIAVLKSWLKKRIKWMDENILGVCNQPPILAVTESQLEGQVYPNPFGEELRMEVALPGAGPVVIDIYNTVGANIFHEENRGAQAGLITRNLQLKGLPAGVYFVRVTQNQGIWSQKIVKAQ
jgi:hypothetical protein